MDNSDLLNKVHSRVVDEMLGKGRNPGAQPARLKDLMQKDQNLRKAIAEFYVALNALGDPAMAVDMIAEHVAILIEMINQYKGGSK